MVIRCSVTISLVEEARGGPFVFWHDLPAACRRAAELGFDGVEVFPPDGQSVDRGELGAQLRECGLSLAAVGTGGGWVRHGWTLIASDREDRERALSFVRNVIDLGAEFGAPAIIGSMQGRAGGDVDHAEAKRRLGEAFEALGEHARSRGVPLLYEPLNRYESNLINTLADATAFLGDLSTHNVRLLADLFHMNIEECDLAPALRDAGPAVGHVHFADSNRRAAGLGHTDFGAVVAALRDIGYDGFMSAEVFPYPDPDAAAAQTIEEFRRLHAGGTS